VPLRLPDTICVQQRLPPGAAAVLINQAHAFTDLYLPIDARQKQLFDAIDGARTIGEIVRKHGDPDTARALFEPFWWYDQVVFNARRRRDIVLQGNKDGRERGGIAGLGLNGLKAS
jgi:hypothetical protein